MVIELQHDSTARRNGPSAMGNQPPAPEKINRTNPLPLGSSGLCNWRMLDEFIKLEMGEIRGAGE